MAWRIPFPRFYVLAAGLVAVALLGMFVPSAYAARIGGFGGAAGLWTASVWALRRI